MDTKKADVDDPIFREMFNIPSDSDFKSPGVIETAMAFFVILGGACVLLAAIHHYF